MIIILNETVILNVVKNPGDPSPSPKLSSLFVRYIPIEA